MNLALTGPWTVCYNAAVPITVCCVEDDPGIRENLEKLISKAQGFRCLGLYPDAATALVEIPRRKPDVVLMDINLPKMSGIECVRELKNSMPSARIIMFTVYEEPDQLFRALTAGASGYLLKRTPPEKLLQSIMEVHQGGAPMSRQIARKVVQYFHSLGSLAGNIEKLSPREHQTLELLAHGLRYKEIADRLGLSYETVREHVTNIYHKLHVTSRTEAVVRYLQRRPATGP